MTSARAAQAAPPTLSDYQARPPHPQRRSGGRRLAGHMPPAGDPDRPLVTIVTPVRNGAATLERALRSVFAQDYPAVETVVVDGASTDGTLDILRRYDEALDCWISEPDSGISDAFNKGIALATGDIIGILNADDWYEPDAVSKVVAAFAAAGADAVCGALQYWIGDQQGLIFYSNPDNLRLESTVNHPTLFVRRAVYEQHGLFQTRYRYAMDYDLILRFYLRGVRFHVLPDVLANMQLGGRSDSAVFPVSRELYQIKTALMGRPIRHALYSVYHFARTHVSKFLRRSGADWLLDAYRRRHSVVRKARGHGQPPDSQ